MSLADKLRIDSACYYCRLDHRQVEAGGVWYCPNPLCPGPGGAAFRHKLDSYQEVDLVTGKHTVDDLDWLTTALKDPPEDEVVRRAMFRCAMQMIRVRILQLGSTAERNLTCDD